MMQGIGHTLSGYGSHLLQPEPQESSTGVNGKEGGSSAGVKGGSGKGSAADERQRGGWTASMKHLIIDEDQNPAGDVDYWCAAESHQMQACRASPAAAACQLTIQKFLTIFISTCRAFMQEVSDPSGAAAQHKHASDPTVPTLAQHRPLIKTAQRLLAEV
jgi:hypothetical protein